MLRLMTLNVGSCFEPGWEERRHEVVAWIEHLDPDVVCLQEVWQSDSTDNTATWIASQLTSDRTHVFGGHPASGPPAADQPGFLFGSAVISRWPIDEHHTYRLPVADAPEDAYLTDIPWELLHARTAGLDVFTTHLAAAPNHGRHRRTQVQAIERHVRAIRKDRDTLSPTRSSMPPILTGDFNAEPDSDEIRWLCGFTSLQDADTFWQDAWSAAGNHGPGLTQDWSTHPLAAGLNVHRKRIDYVFVGDPFLRPGSGGRVEAARVVAHEPLTGIQASDHCGLYVEVSWPDRPDT